MKNQQHQFENVKLIDHQYDEIIYTEVCDNCGQERLYGKQNVGRCIRETTISIQRTVTIPVEPVSTWEANNAFIQLKNRLAHNHDEPVNDCEQCYILLGQETI